MRHGSSSRRPRNKSGGRRNNGGNRMKVYDSNGPDVRIRGTANQVHEKYMALAKDSSSSGDLIMAESYLQHAEHYQRLINEFEEQKAERSERQQNPKAKSAPEAQGEDLSLPGSIVGASADTSSEMESA